MKKERFQFVLEGVNADGEAQASALYTEAEEGIGGAVLEISGRSIGNGLVLYGPDGAVTHVRAARPDLRVVTRPFRAGELMEARLAGL